MQKAILLNLIILMLGSFISACVTYFLHWCIGSPGDYDTKKGRIFSFYGLWITQGYEKVELQNQDPKHRKLNWYKAAGMCIYCFGTWISFLSLAVGFLLGWYNLVTPVHSLEVLILVIIYPSLSNLFLRKIK